MTISRYMEGKLDHLWLYDESGCPHTMIQKGQSTGLKFVLIQLHKVKGKTDEITSVFLKLFRAKIKIC